MAYPDQEVFTNEARHVFEAFRARGMESRILAGDGPLLGGRAGNWSFSAGALTEVDDAAEAASALRMAGSRTPKGSDLVLYVGDHGMTSNRHFFVGPPGGAGDPDDTGVVFTMNPFASLLKWGEIVDSARRGLPSESSLKIIASACFSGGVHRAVARNEKSCALAATDYLSVSWFSLKPNITNFDSLVAEQVRKAGFDPDRSGKSSLMEAYFYALEHDALNGVRPSISSFDYVDQVLQEGPYHPEREAEAGWREEVGSMVESCQSAPFGPRLVDPKALSNVMDLYRAIRQAEANADWNDIPESLRRVHAAALSGAKGRGLEGLSSAVSGKEARESERKIAELRRKWESLEDPTSAPALLKFHQFTQAGVGAEWDVNERAIDAKRRELSELSGKRADAERDADGAVFFRPRKSWADLQARWAEERGKESLERLEQRRKELLKANPGIDRQYSGLLRDRDSHVARVWREVDSAYQVLRNSVELPTRRQQHVAVLEEKMTRVARFMRSATEKQKKKYLSLLNCELEDL